MELREVEPTQAATSTYQYLRIGMVGIVGLLAVSIAIEYGRTPGEGCFQPSISAYYFTPVRALFVGGLTAIGAALIFISGRTKAEDVLLNIAGMLAPVVAVIPTTDVGNCYSTPPPADPVIDGELAPWVVAGVQNNIPALLVMGVVGLFAVAMMPVVKERRSPWRALISSDPSTKASLGLIVLVLVGAWYAYARWDGFYEHAHGYAAVAMFGFLALAVASNAWERRRRRNGWFWSYVVIAAAMPLTGIVVWLAGDGWVHAVLVLEAVEIGLFVAFWSLQTVRYWNRTVDEAM